MGFVMGNVANPYVNPTKKTLPFGTVDSTYLRSFKITYDEFLGTVDTWVYTLHNIPNCHYSLLDIAFFLGWVNLVDHLAVSRRLPEPQA